MMLTVCMILVSTNPLLTFSLFQIHIFIKILKMIKKKSFIAKIRFDVNAFVKL